MLTKRFVAVLSLSTSVIGCGRPAEKVVVRWLSSECEERGALALDAGATKEVWSQPPAGKGSCKSDKTEVDAKGCDDTKVGDYCDVTLNDRTAPFCIKRTGDRDFKLDVACSYGVSDRSLAVLRDKALDAERAVLVRGVVKLTDREVKGYNSTKFFTVSVGGFREHQPIYGVAHREAPHGSRLYELLQDGREHRLLLFVGPPFLGGDLGDVEIVDYVASDWRPPESGRQERASSLVKGVRRCCSRVESLAAKVSPDVIETKLRLAAEPAQRECHAASQALLDGQITANDVLARVRAKYPDGPPQDCLADR